MQQAAYWLLTIPHYAFLPYLPPSTDWVIGQLEEGSTTGFRHWQLVVHFKKKVRLGGVTATFGNFHAEPTRSDAAIAYVHKEDTAIQGTRFELGSRPLSRARKEDWCEIRASAERGDLTTVPDDIYVRHYNQLRRIAKDHANAPFRPNIEVNVFWGATGAGKSHRAFTEATERFGDGKFYIKSATTKWWDAYRGEECVIIDEFRGSIDVCHLLRWLDKYPCLVEEKGGQVPLKARVFYLMSNMNPRDWYPTLDEETKKAFLRRLTNIVYYPEIFQQQ